MRLDREKLENGCFEVAKSVLWAQKPVDVSEIENLSQAFVKEALWHQEFVSNCGRDPNLITAAVVYLGNRHAIPPMADDMSWFVSGLNVLIELCCPNQNGQIGEEPFFVELEAGIAESRQTYGT